MPACKSPRLEELGSGLRSAYYVIVSGAVDLAELDRRFCAPRIELVGLAVAGARFCGIVEMAIVVAESKEVQVAVGLCFSRL